MKRMRTLCGYGFLCVLGLMQRRELEDAARAIGAYTTSGEIADSAEWVRL
jgi:hypothetical protein